MPFVLEPRRQRDHRFHAARAMRCAHAAPWRRARHARRGGQRARRGAARTRAAPRDARHGVPVLEPQLRVALLARGVRRPSRPRRAARRDPAAANGREPACGARRRLLRRRAVEQRRGRRWARRDRRHEVAALAATASRKCSRCVRRSKRGWEQLGPLLRALAAAAGVVRRAGKSAPSSRACSREPALPRHAGRDRRGARSAAWCSGREVARGRPSFLCFHGTPRTCRAPEDALWIYAQMVRWGQLARSAAARSAARARVSPRSARALRGFERYAAVRASTRIRRNHVRRPRRRWAISRASTCQTRFVASRIADALICTARQRARVALTHVAQKRAAA